jgi:hypothetical protein
VLSPGDHSITAAYACGVNFAGSASVVLVQTVQQVTTTTTVSSDINPSILRQPVVLTAMVASAGGTPTGSVTFKDGTRILGTAELAAGQASLTTSAIAAGNRSITAEYPGDGLFEPSASDALTQSVVYQFEGFFTPLSTAGTISDPSDSGSENLGSAVPIKWRLSDFEGTYIVKRRAAKSLTVLSGQRRPGRQHAALRSRQRPLRLQLRYDRGSRDRAGLLQHHPRARRRQRAQVDDYRSAVELECAGVDAFRAGIFP